jgi:hypothetical protein
MESSTAALKRGMGGVLSAILDERDTRLLYTTGKQPRISTEYRQETTGAQLRRLTRTVTISTSIVEVAIMELR